MRNLFLVSLEPGIISANNWKKFWLRLSAADFASKVLVAPALWFVKRWLASQVLLEHTHACVLKATRIIRSAPFQSILEEHQQTQDKFDSHFIAKIAYINSFQLLLYIILTKYRGLKQNINSWTTFTLEVRYGSQ